MKRVVTARDPDSGCPGSGVSGAEVAVAVYAGRGRGVGAGRVGVSGPDAALRSQSAADRDDGGAAGAVCRELPVARADSGHLRHPGPGPAGLLHLFKPVEEIIADASASIFCLLYTGLTLIALPALREQANGPSLVVFLLCVVWSGDTAAYYVGREWGRHKMAPKLSPGKSWEGAAASVAGSVLIAPGLPGWPPCCRSPGIRLRCLAGAGLSVCSPLLSRRPLVLAGAGRAGQCGRRRWATWPNRR